MAVRLKLFHSVAMVATLKLNLFHSVVVRLKLFHSVAVGLKLFDSVAMVATLILKMFHCGNGASQTEVVPLCGSQTEVQWQSD